MDHWRLVMALSSSAWLRRPERLTSWETRASTSPTSTTGAQTGRALFSFPLFFVAHTVVAVVSLRGTIANRTYGIHKNLPGVYLTIFPITVGHS